MYVLGLVKHQLFVLGQYMSPRSTSGHDKAIIDDAQLHSSIRFADYTKVAIETMLLSSFGDCDEVDGVRPSADNVLEY